MEAILRVMAEVGEHLVQQVKSAVNGNWGTFCTPWIESDVCLTITNDKFCKYKTSLTPIQQESSLKEIEVE